MLASDVNNPDFSGAVHPDSSMAVEFYINDTKEHRGREFVRIYSPGSANLFMHDQPVREQDKERFPRHYLAFKMSQGEGPVIGTPIEAWREAQPDVLGEVRLAELKILKFTTVEQLATATDMQIQRLGMGADGLRTQARDFLKGRNADLASGRDEQMAEMARQLQETQAQLAELLARPNRGGRPPGSKTKKRTVTRGQHLAPVGDAGNG